MKQHRIGLFVLFFLVIFMTLGCAASSGKVEMARDSLSRAEELGGEQNAPYEYYAAQAYYALAKHEVKDFDYKQAGIFAEQARTFAEQAINKSGGAK